MGVCAGLCVHPDLGVVGCWPGFLAVVLTLVYVRRAGLPGRVGLSMVEETCRSSGSRLRQLFFGWVAGGCAGGRIWLHLCAYATGGGQGRYPG
ncbi:hypothetical protein D3C76_1582370 [compost metagenome]